MLFFTFLSIEIGEKVHLHDNFILKTQTSKLINFI